MKTNENPLWNDFLDLAQALMPEPPCAALRRAIAKSPIAEACENTIAPNSALAMIRARMGRALGWA